MIERISSRTFRRTTERPRSYRPYHRSDIAGHVGCASNGTAGNGCFFAGLSLRGLRVLRDFV